jgi:spore coat protein A, manganese oxidase
MRRLALISRRKFLRRAGVLATGLSIEKATVATGIAPPSSALDPNTLKPYVDPLPLPEVVKSIGSKPDPSDPNKTLPLYRVAMQEIHQKVHRDLPATRMWGFNGTSPGPIFETRSGQGLMVEWQNKLPLKHFLPIDHTLHGAEADKPEVRCVIHLHGGKTPAASDGYPEDWVVPGKSLLYHYPNNQAASTLFYHDHTMGINRLNIYAGLQGLFIIRDEAEETLNLPKGKYEIPLLLFDRFLRSDGQLEYPVSGDPKSPWVPEVYSNVMLANGRLSPYLDVEPRKYRLRIMNGSNARFFRLSFGNLLPMHQISSDQGLLSAPIKMKRLLLAPAERADIIFDFSQHAGEKIILKSDSFDIMQFRVASSGAPDNSSLPPALKTVPRIPETQAIKTRRLTLDETMDKVQQSMGMMLNNTAWHQHNRNLGTHQPHGRHPSHPLTSSEVPVARSPQLRRLPVSGQRRAALHRPRHSRKPGRVRLEGHHPLRDWSNNPNHRSLRGLHRPLRLALPSSRARRQRNDAAFRGSRSPQLKLVVVS